MTRCSLLALVATLAACATGSTVPCRCGSGGEICSESRCVPPDGGAADAAEPMDASPLLDAPPPDVPGCDDADADGYPDVACGGNDCDDSDELVHPGASELCDGRDQDCDPRIDEGSFEAFFVGAGSTAWRRYELDCTSPAAPALPVQTVFDVESLSRAYFLTASTYHVLDLRNQRWIGNGARGTIMPEAAGAVFVAAFATPAGHAGSSTTIEMLYVGTGSRVYVYEIDISSPSSPVFTLATLSGGANPIDWTAPEGLETAYQDVTGTWAPDPRPTCPDATYAAGPYAAYFTGDRVLIHDNGSCFVRIADQPIASFGPFTSSSAPAREAWRHVIYNAGLWLFAAPALP